MRLVGKESYGLIGYANLAINSLQLFREMGFSSALIYRRVNVQEAASTMFIIVVVISFLLYGLAFMGAPYIAIFFEEPRITDVLRTLALSMVFAAIGQVPFTMLAKELDFKKRLVPDIVPEVIGDATAIILAFHGFGVWSLVWSQLLDAALTAGLVWVVSPWRLRWHFDRKLAGEMFSYGRNIVGSQVLIFLITNLDDAFVGKLRGTGDLGLYNRAYTYANLPATHITRLIGQVMFPAMSKISDDVDRMRRAFFKAVKMISAVSIPLGVVMVVFAWDFFNEILGKEWIYAVRPLQFLTIYGVLRSIAAIMGDVFKAGGKPHWLFWIAAGRLTAMVAFLYPVTVNGGVIGVSILSALVSIVDFVISVSLVNRILHASVRTYLRLLTPIITLSIVAVVVARGIYGIFVSWYSPAALALAGLTMLIVYGILIFTLDADMRGMVLRIVEDLPVKSAGRMATHLRMWEQRLPLPSSTKEWGD